MKMIQSKQWTEIFDQIPGLSWHRLLWWSDTQLFTKIGLPRSSLQSCSWWWAKPWWWWEDGDNDDKGCSLYQTSFHFHKNRDCKRNRFQHCFKAGWRSPIKIHCEKSLSTTSNTTCHHHCFNHINCCHCHHRGHLFKKMSYILSFKISAPSHILVCALIYLPYLPVNLRHIFHQIPHIQLVPMCSNLHCCTYNNFSHKILHRIFHALFCRFLQNLLRIGSNALQWRIWPLHKPTVWQRSFITSQYSPSLSDIHLRSQYRVIWYSSRITIQSYLQ